MQLTLLLILAVMSELGPTDASSTLERMERVLPSREIPSLPAFYRHLRRAMETGWVVVEGTEKVEDTRGGRPARLYRVTPEGRAAVRERALELSSIAAMVLEAGGT